MTFRPPKKPPQFADLKGILSQTKKGTDAALYQTVQEIIDRLGQFKDTTDKQVADINNSVSNTETNVTIINTINANSTYLTKANEVAVLPNSIQVLPGTGIVFDDTVPNKRTINSTASGMNLDYLGDYVAATIYNDGDIVIGADGVAYMCVVDGTNTPPEPWPMGTSGGGGGGGGGAPVAATYWVVSPHADLVNERALSLLANGYVKSTGGEPSTIAVIPLSEGGTGATTAPTARTNLGLGTMAVQNANNVAITGGNISGPTTINVSSFIATSGNMVTNQLEVSGPIGPLYLTDTGGALDQKRWRMAVSGGSLLIQAFNDALTVVQSTVFITRDGTYHGSGAGLTNLNASNLSHGLVATPRLGSGTANSGTFLRGDQTWAAPPTSEVFPSGLIVISLFPCPPGWTRIVWEGVFIRGGPTPGLTGGTADHQHGLGDLQIPDHVHGPGSYVAANHDHGGSVGVSVTINGTTGTAGAHAHFTSGTINGSTQGASVGPQTADAGGSFQTVGPHTHNVSINYGNFSDTQGDHNHSFSGSGSGSGAIPANQPAVSGVSAGSGAIGLVGGMGAAAHIPPFVDVFFCQKN